MESAMDLLRELREDHDCSQKDIAAILGISQQYYSKYETGDYDLPLSRYHEAEGRLERCLKTSFRHVVC